MSKRTPKHIPRQKPISIDTDTWTKLNQLRDTYSAEFGRKVTWAEFLYTMSLLGLSSSGIHIYPSAESELDSNGVSLTVICPICGKEFVVLSPPKGLPRAALITCPICLVEQVLFIRE